MKTEYKPRKDRDKRRKLEDVIPVEQPFYIFIDPASACNISCLFCGIEHKRNTKQEVLKIIAIELAIVIKHLRVMSFYCNMVLEHTE